MVYQCMTCLEVYSTKQKMCIQTSLSCITKNWVVADRCQDHRWFPRRQPHATSRAFRLISDTSECTLKCTCVCTVMHPSQHTSTQYCKQPRGQIASWSHLWPSESNKALAALALGLHLPGAAPIPLFGLAHHHVLFSPVSASTRHVSLSGHQEKTLASGMMETHRPYGVNDMGIGRPCRQGVKHSLHKEKSRHHF